MNSKHIIKADVKTLKPVSLRPWEEINEEEETQLKRAVWAWSDLFGWNQFGHFLVLDLPDVGKIELISKYSKEISFYLKSGLSQEEIKETRFSMQVLSDSESDTLGSWEFEEATYELQKPKSQSSDSETFSDIIEFTQHD